MAFGRQADRVLRARRPARPSGGSPERSRNDWLGAAAAVAASDGAKKHKARGDEGEAAHEGSQIWYAKLHTNFGPGNHTGLVNGLVCRSSASAKSAVDSFPPRR